MIGRINVWILVSYMVVIAATWFPMWDYLMKELGDKAYEEDKEWNHRHENTMVLTMAFKVISFTGLIIAIGIKTPMEFVNFDSGVFVILVFMGALLVICLIASKMIHDYHFKKVDVFLHTDTRIDLFRDKLKLSIVPDQDAFFPADEVTEIFINNSNPT
jgi:NADH:ubiquinone oxidoreductase subunit 5 (subunit L)/multisubunit Na+/H+ antiporter MnhA subunit